MRTTLALLACLLASPAAAESVIGPVRIVDGDSIVVAGQMVRLEALDAPEWDQVCHRGDPPRRYRCGLDAKDALIRLIAGRPVTCDGVRQADGTERDRYGRLLGLCRVGDTAINAWLVEQGHAVAFVRYSDRFVAEEARARAAGRGIWAGPFMRPEEWRAAKRAGY